jgi:hypothetical protein
MKAKGRIIILKIAIYIEYFLWKFYKTGPILKSSSEIFRIETAEHKGVMAEL